MWGSRRSGIWEVYTHIPGGKPAPGFTFGIDRLLLCPATMSPGSNGWRDGPPGRAKVDPEESHNQSPPWRYYRVMGLSIVCGYVSAVFIEVAAESGRIGRLIWDRITAEVSQMSRSDFRNRAGCQLGRRKDETAFAGPLRPGESTSTTRPSALPR